MGTKLDNAEHTAYFSNEGAAYVHVDGKSIPCTSVRVDTAPNSLLLVTLTFIPRSLDLKVKQGED